MKPKKNGEKFKQAPPLKEAPLEASRAK